MNRNIRRKSLYADTLLMWCNTKLSVGTISNTLDLVTNDGEVLSELLNILSDGEFTRYKVNTKRGLHHKKTDRRPGREIDRCLCFLEHEGVWISCGPKAKADLKEGTDHILDLLADLLLHYCVLCPLRPSPDCKEEARTLLLIWINRTLPRTNSVCDFTLNWNDGRALGALLNGISPDMCPGWENWDTDNHVGNLTLAMNAAQKHLIGVEKLLDAVDMCYVHIMDINIIAYLSQLLTARLGKKYEYRKVLQNPLDWSLLDSEALMQYYVVDEQEPTSFSCHDYLQIESEATAIAAIRDTDTAVPQLPERAVTMPTRLSNRRLPPLPPPETQQMQFEEDASSQREGSIRSLKYGNLNTIPVVIAARELSKLQAETIPKVIDTQYKRNVYNEDPTTPKCDQECAIMLREPSARSSAYSRQNTAIRFRNTDAVAPSECYDVTQYIDVDSVSESAQCSCQTEETRRTSISQETQTDFEDVRARIKLASVGTMTSSTAEVGEDDFAPVSAVAGSAGSAETHSVSPGVEGRSTDSSLSEEIDDKEEDAAWKGAMATLDIDAQNVIKQLWRKSILFEHGRIVYEGSMGAYKRSRCKINNTWNIYLVKSLSDDSSDRKSFLEEVHTRNKLSHNNILELIAITACEGQLHSIMPRVDYGTLQEYISNRKQVKDFADRLLICQHMAQAMEYITSLDYVIQNLTMETYMVTSDKVVKLVSLSTITDVIQGRKIKYTGDKSINYQRLAPEVFNDDVYSVSANVWMLSVLMWIVFSDGQEPYAGSSPYAVCGLLAKGDRLPKPDEMAPEIYKLLLECWAGDPFDRPTFSDVWRKLEAFRFAGPDGYLEFYDKHARVRDTRPCRVYSRTPNDMDVYDDVVDMPALPPRAPLVQSLQINTPNGQRKVAAELEQVMQGSRVIGRGDGATMQQPTVPLDLRRNVPRRLSYSNVSIPEAIHELTLTKSTTW